MPIKIPPSTTLSRYQFAPHYLQIHLAELPSSQLYDIGAGDGRMRTPVEALGLSWHGFDLFPARADILKWDLDHPCPLPGSAAGAVILLDVIEHLSNPGLGLKNIAQAMQPGGKLIITTPNPRWGRSRIYALLHGTPGCFTQSDLDLNGHVFPVWPHILEKMLNDSGFKVDEYVTLDGPTVWPSRPFSIRYPLRVLHAMLNKLIEYFDPSACGMSYAIVARKQDD
jgi:SAM-dependent methyltransferase